MGRWLWGNSARLCLSRLGRKKGPGHRWARAPPRQKPHHTDMQPRKKRKFVSSEWSWISDRLEQPVQSRENLIPPVLFTRRILIRCEETAAREKRVSPVPGEETSCSFVIFRELVRGMWGAELPEGLDAAARTPWPPLSGPRGSFGRCGADVATSHARAELYPRVLRRIQRRWTRLDRSQNEAATVQEALLVCLRNEAFLLHHLLEFGVRPAWQRGRRATFCAPGESPMAPPQSWRCCPPSSGSGVMTGVAGSPKGLQGGGWPSRLTPALTVWHRRMRGPGWRIISVVPLPRCVESQARP